MTLVPGGKRIQFHCLEILYFVHDYKPGPGAIPAQYETPSSYKNAK